MNWTILGWLATAGVLALFYLGVIHLAAASERSRRRRGEAQFVAAHIFPPGRGRVSLVNEVALFLRRLRGMVDDQPCALPLLAAILAGGLLLILALDPVLDDPMLFPATLPLPGWLKGIWAGGVVLLVLGHAVWIFLKAPQYLSRQWVVLHPDGAITARGAALPRLDPALPVRHFEGISMPGPDPQFPPRWAAGAVLVQGETVAGFVYFPHPPSPGEMRPLAVTPPGWWRINLGPEHTHFDQFVKRHYPPGVRAVAPGWPP